MNSFLKEKIKNCSPKIKNLSQKDLALYKLGLTTLANIISNDFFDIEELPQERKYGKDGFFYEIPYYNFNELWNCGTNRRMLLVVHKIKNNSSFCPLRLEIDYRDSTTMYIYVCYQGEKDRKRYILIGREDKYMFSQIEGVQEIKLTDLLRKGEK